MQSVRKLGLRIEMDNVKYFLCKAGFFLILFFKFSLIFKYVNVIFVRVFCLTWR